MKRADKTRIKKSPELARIIRIQRDFFAEGKTLNPAFRKEHLVKLKKAVKNRETEIYEALHSDFRKPEFETFETEIGTVLSELTHAIKNVTRWSKPKRVRTPFTHLPGKSEIFPEPYGLVLIISPWNYPFNLAMAPLIGAVAAGNTVMLKPASASPAVSSVINKIIGDAFPEEYVTVLEGEAVKKTLLDYQYDYIFYTGGTEAGREIMEKAAVHLTPVTLELGGKSPCIVADDADLQIAARRIAWGKFINGGQTCIAPDYLMLSEKIKKEFLDAMVAEIKKFYGDNVQNNPDFSRIISDRHFARLERLLHRGRIVIGGEVNPATRYISPTVIDLIKPGDPVMDEEIFGPVLPVITYNNINEVFDFIKKRPKPLALYLFSKSSLLIRRVIREISYGGGCINDTLMHFANSNLPFGGVGLSGMGAYHGMRSFDAFTHYKAVFTNRTFIDIPFRYPPYSDFGKRILKIFMR